jgi:hypothetical protein
VITPHLLALDLAYAGQLVPTHIEIGVVIFGCLSNLLLFLVFIVFHKAWQVNFLFFLSFLRACWFFFC